MKSTWEDLSMANRSFTEQLVAIHFVTKFIVLRETATLSLRLKVAIIYSIIVVVVVVVIVVIIIRKKFCICI
jgi:hypothetical protein